MVTRKQLKLLFVVAILFYLVIYTCMLSRQYTALNVMVLTLSYETHIIPRDVSADNHVHRTRVSIKADGLYGSKPSTSSNTSFPGEPDSDNKWHFVDINRTACVFSAYSVNRSKVVVIGASRSFWKTNFVALMWYKSETMETLELEETRCLVTRIGEDHGRK